MADHPAWRVLLLDTKRSNPNHYICVSIERALRQDPRVELVSRGNLGNALQLATERRCNLFLAFDGEELHRGICERLRSMCGLGILWVTEDPYELPVNLKNAELFDLVFTNDSASVAAYRGRARHLPFAGGPEFQHLPVLEDHEFRYDLFFAGTAWPNRVELLRQLTHSLQGLQVKLALSVNPHLPRVELDLPVSTYNWRTPNSQFARFANVSRTVLTLHRDFSTSPGAPTAAATPGPRLFEVALAGGFQLVDGSLPEVARYFEPAREIPTFSSRADCVDKLRHYLAHPEVRIAMARAAQARALREHTYAQRVGSILDAAGAHMQVATPAADVGAPARPRVLMVTHNVIGDQNWGGVEVYQDWVRQTLAQDYEIWTYTSVEGSSGRVCALLDPELRQVEREEFPTAAHEALLSCPHRENAFARIVQKYQVAVVHFQHLMLHVPSLPLIARALGAPTVWSLHDYYGVCQEFNLLGADGRYCEVERQTETGCDMCLGRSREAFAGSQARRRAFYRLALEGATVLHANTEGVRRRHEAVYGSLRRHGGWEIMGVPIAESQTAARTDAPAPGGRLRVAIPGNFTRQKGAEILCETIRLLRDEPIDFAILGRVDRPAEERLQRTGNANLTVHGAYDPAQAEDLLRDVDVTLHASIWPETYCLTLSEAFRAGAVPVVTDIGALGERVRDGDNGLKFDLASPDELVHLLLALARDPSKLLRLRAGLTSSDYVTHAEHRQWLLGVYGRLAAYAPLVSPGVESADGLTLSDCGIYLNQPIWLERPAGPSPQVSAAPPAMLSIPLRAVMYLSRHGLRATVRRASSELLSRAKLPH